MHASVSGPDLPPVPSGHLPGEPSAGVPVGSSSGFADADAGTLPGEQLAGAALLETEPTLWAVVLAGGIGSRFWPLSSPERPKQLLALVGDRPLIADTVARLQPLVPAERVLVVTSRDIAEPLRAAIPEVPEANMLVEPHPMGTAAALAWGAQEVSRRAGPDTVFCTLHADLAVGQPEEFRRVVRGAAVIAADEDALVVVGARPTRAETGFGYLQPGQRLDATQGLEQNGACRVARYVEKPTEQLAQALVGDGALWNTGTFVWRARTVLAELAAVTPEIAPGLDALALGDMEAFAALITSVSLDRGLLERTRRAVVLPADLMWDDVGTWASLRRARELDDTGNGAVGPAHFVDCSGNVVHTEAGTVVMYGVDSLVVVVLDGLTFVTTLERAQDLRGLLDRLPDDVRNRARRLPERES